MKNQSVRDLIFNPLLYTEYPYHWQDENGTIIFSKKPRFTLAQEIEIKNKIKEINIFDKYNIFEKENNNGK